MKFFPQAQMQSPTDMCTHALFILSKEKGESKGEIFFIAIVSTGKKNEKGFEVQGLIQGFTRIVIPSKALESFSFANLLIYMRISLNGKHGNREWLGKH